jgi:hypothetical protein
MDQGRSLVPLAVDDPTAYSVPLMGVWAAGVDSVRHPLVAATCIKFLCSKALADKALEVDKSFLVLLYAQGKASVPVCFECHVGLDSGAVPLRAAVFSAAEPPSETAGAAVCELTPTADACLPGCPTSTGRRQGGSTAAPASNERQSWHPGSKHSPGVGTYSISQSILREQAGMFGLARPGKKLEAQYECF